MERTKLTLLLAKIETTSGVDATPTAAANAIQTVGIPEIDPGFLESGNRDDVITGVMGVVDRSPPAGWNVNFSVTVEARGAGAPYAAGVAPPADVFWRISGLGKTTSFTGGLEFYRYSTLDSGMETATIYGYGGGKVFKIVNCSAQPKLSAEVNKRGMITFQVQGKVTEVSQAAVPVPTFTAPAPPLFHSGAASISTWTSTSPAGDPLKIYSAELDFGTETGEDASAGATDGYIGHIITDRKVRQTLVVGMPLVATSDIYNQAKLSSASLNLLTAWQIGTAQYNRLKIVTGRWALEAPKRGNRNGLVTANLTGFLVQGTEATSGRELYLLYD